jgi:hypothetical protein
MRKKNYLILSLIALFLLIFLIILNFQLKDKRFELQEIASNLTAPIKIISDPMGSDKLYILEQGGIIKTIENNEVNIFLDISDKIVSDFKNTIFGEFDERGLLGLAFHPNYVNNKKFYLYYSADVERNSEFDHKNIVVEHKSNESNYERIILESNHPQFNHNAGEIVFGPDGYLYIGIGDGGGANDNFKGHTEGFGNWQTAPEKDYPNLGNAQDLSNFKGKILRIDVDKKPENKNVGEYSIPLNNPFIDSVDKKEEIYIYGLRNPWRFSFDEKTGNLYIGDVGQDDYEEITLIKFNKQLGTISPTNAGWKKYEGNHIFDKDNNLDESLSLVFPIAEYAHPGTEDTSLLKLGISITGGFVYYADLNPYLKGKYIFADWSNEFEVGKGKVFFITPPKIVPSEPTASLKISEIFIENLYSMFITSIGKDNSGELYITSTTTGYPSENNGFVYKLVQKN